MPVKFQLLFGALIAIAIAIVVVPLVLRSREAKSWPSALLAALAVLIGSTLAYSNISSWHWPQAGEAQPGIDVASLESRTRADPDDVESWARLGVTYLQNGRVDAAVTALERAQSISRGTSADITLALVDALVAQGDANRPRVNELVENLLVLAPTNARALLYGAELAFSQQDYATAKMRWQSLLERAQGEDSEQSRNVAKVLRERIALADRHAGIPTAAPESVTVEVDIDPGLRAGIAAGTQLFVLARANGEPGPPVAVVRRSVAELPFEVVLTDRDAMMPSRALSAFDTVEIVARVATGGTPVAQSGDLFGAVTLERSGNDRVRVVISEVYP